MRDKKSGMILQFPITPVHHEIPAKLYTNNDNIQFSVSMSFDYNISQPDQFKLVTNFDYEDLISQMDNRIIEGLKKIVKNFSIYNTDLTQLKNNFRLHITQSISDIEDKFKISFSDFKINDLNVLINESNIKKFVITYAKIYNVNKD